MDVALPLLLLASVVALIVIWPLKTGPRDGTGRAADRLAELEAAKEAKYREIRDAELDHRMGKSSEEDWRSLDSELRAQAIEILRELDKLDGR